MLLNEQSRRFQEMTRMLGQSPGDLPVEQNLLIDVNSQEVKNILKFKDEARQDQVDLFIEQVYDLAMLGQQSFDKDQMERFLERSGRLLELVKTKSGDFLPK